MFQWRVVWHSHCGNIVPKTLVPVSGPWRRAWTICDEKEEKWFIIISLRVTKVLWNNVRRLITFHDASLFCFARISTKVSVMRSAGNGTAWLMSFGKSTNARRRDEGKENAHSFSRFNLISEYPFGNFINGYEALARLVLRVIHIQDWVDENAKQKTP